MKMVFTKAEVAEALGLDEPGFDAARARLEAHGFPRPIGGLEQCWSLLNVISWVNREGTDFVQSTSRPDPSATVVPLRRQSHRSN